MFLRRTILTILALGSLFMVRAEEAPLSEPDTTIQVKGVEITAIKQGLDLTRKPLSSSIVGRRMAERLRLEAVKDLSTIVPNLHAPQYGSRMTSSIYMRGLGARIDHPVMGLNIDNVPILNKDAYDFEVADIERVEVLRGPQSTLYGRNTMGGVMNIYTLSPLQYSGVRGLLEYSSGNTLKVRASAYNQLGDRAGLSVAGNYSRSDGLFRNLYSGELLDWEESVGARLKFAWRAKGGLELNNTLSFSLLDQGGYPYAYLPTHEIAYNDPSGYERLAVMDAFTLQYSAEKFTLSSITSIQYLDDLMRLDQDFLPASYFTLAQERREVALTEEIVLKGRRKGAYQWLVGLMGFYKRYEMAAPVTFKAEGLEELIISNVEQYTGLRPQFEGEEFPLLSDFESPTWGLSLYHESAWEWERWQVEVGLRIDYEEARLDYLSQTTQGCTIGLDQIDPFALSGRLKKSALELLPKFSLSYRFGADRLSSIYLSVARGYKAGGFNTQMFSEVLQNALMERMGAYATRDFDIEQVVAYDPETSWNYELGGHVEALSGDFRANWALFLIDCRNQQLTIFPPGQITGRMMTNAGRMRSWGAELSVALRPLKHWRVDAAWGYTHATFRRYESGSESYRGKRVPYAPEQTLSVQTLYEIEIGASWLERLTPRLELKGVGPIYWNESNTLKQEFYALLGASLRFEHKHYALDLWCRNLLDERYATFYFKSVGNDFLQQGLPRTFGATLSLEF
uniref:TonB-dependent receptor n=1 Tax=Alistipes sp. TaxID=1872444 RepID=UPI0040573F24